MVNSYDVGRVLRRLRGDRSQQAVALAADLHRQTIGAYENGVRLPAEDRLEHLLEALGVDRFTFEVELLDIWEERLAQEAPDSRIARNRALRLQAEALGSEALILSNRLTDFANRLSAEGWP